MKSFVCVILAVLSNVAVVCLAAPEPAIVPGPEDWTVDVRFEHPQQIVLPQGSETQPKRFWYTILTLTNKTNRDVDFYPKAELMTDTFQIVPAGKGISEAIFDQIKRRHQSRYPFLEPLEKAGNKVLQGEDNTKDIAVIWSDFDSKTKGIKLFVAGLSNETVVIDHPVAKGSLGEPVKIYLRKTLELSYELSGDPAFRSNTKLVFKGKRWVMR